MLPSIFNAWEWERRSISNYLFFEDFPSGLEICVSRNSKTKKTILGKFVSFSKSPNSKTVRFFDFQMRTEEKVRVTFCDERRQAVIEHPHSLRFDKVFLKIITSVLWVFRVQPTLPPPSFLQPALLLLIATLFLL